MAVASILSFFRPRKPAPDSDGFETELLAQLDSLYSVACRLTRDTTAAEDLVQDTLVKALAARDRFEAGTNIKAWALRIMTNTFINRYRRSGKARDIFEGPDAESLSEGWVSAATLQSLRDPESNTMRSVIQAEMQAAVDALPVEFRVPVLLSDVEGLSYKEIADAVGCPMGTVMSRLHRGRRMLQNQLRDQAIALGIVHESDASEAKEASADPVNLDVYRQRKRGGR